MFVIRTDQNPVPVPATGFRWFNEQQHLPLKEIRREPAEHSPCEKGRVLTKVVENPLVFERLHVFQEHAQNASRRRTAPVRHVLFCNVLLVARLL